MSKVVAGYRVECRAERWVAVFDLLGTKQLLADGREWRVQDSFARAIARAQEDKDFDESISRLWFSDTILFYSSDDSLRAYAALDLVARNFFLALILEHLPARGALTVGSTYIDVDNNIVFGAAIVEAFEYGDSQDWLGFVVCPTAIERLRPHDFPSALNYVEAEVPWSPNREPTGAPPMIPVFIPGRSGALNGNNLLLSNLTRMQSEAGSRNARAKHQRTIEIVKRHGVQAWKFADQPGAAADKPGAGC